KMKLPWLNRDKYRAAHNREKARVNEVESLIEDYSHQAREELHHMISKIDNARREALLYRDEIIPRSELALAGIEAAWRANRATLPEVLEARQILVQGRRSYYRAVADQYIALSELVLCCGAGDLEALQMLQDKNQSSDSADPMNGMNRTSNQNSAEKSK
ncbi:MAG: TolC family protein, partial [Verrucomicrobiota bacterium]